MPLTANALPKNGSLSAQLSFRTGRDIRIVSIENDIAIADDESRFRIDFLDDNNSDFYRKLEQALNKEVLSLQLKNLFSCAAILEQKNGNLIDYNSGQPIVVIEQPHGKSFKETLESFSDSEKFDHESKEKLLKPFSAIESLRNIWPESYFPFIDNFTSEFMLLLTKLENEVNLSDISETRKSLGKWLPLIRKSRLSIVHGNLLPENIIQNKDGTFRLFNHSGLIYGDISLDIAGIIFGLIQASYKTYRQIKEPYITATSLIIQSCTENGVKEINRLLVPYVSYFSFKESSKNKHFFNLARNLLNEEEFDINEINFLMELNFEVEKHEAED